MPKKFSFCPKNNGFAPSPLARTPMASWKDRVTKEEVRVRVSTGQQCSRKRVQQLKKISLDFEKTSKTQQSTYRFAGHLITQPLITH